MRGRPENIFPNAQSGINRILLDPSFAYIEEFNYVESLLDDSCRITATKQRFFTANVGFASYKGFPDMEAFNDK